MKKPERPPCKIIREGMHPGQKPMGWRGWSILLTIFGAALVAAIVTRGS